MSESVIYFGVTRGDNWWCHPMFSWKKLTTFFSHHPLESDDLLAVVSSPLPSSHVLYPVFFLNSPTKIILGWVSPLRPTPWRVSPGAVRPLPSVTPMWNSDWERSGSRSIRSSLQHSFISGIVDSSTSVMPVSYNFFLQYFPYAVIINWIQIWRIWKPLATVEVGKILEFLSVGLQQLNGSTCAMSI